MKFTIATRIYPQNLHEFGCEFVVIKKLCHFVSEFTTVNDRPATIRIRHTFKVLDVRNFRGVNIDLVAANLDCVLVPRGRYDLLHCEN